MLYPGRQEKFPCPDAFSCNVSILQMSVSSNGKVIGGLSYTITFCNTVSMHPLVLFTMNRVGLLPAVLYFHCGFGRFETSAVVVSSPKSQLQPVTVPYLVLVVSVKMNGKSLHAPFAVKPAKNPG